MDSKLAYGVKRARQSLASWSPEVCESVLSVALSKNVRNTPKLSKHQM
jgi:hypothetical protein